MALRRSAAYPWDGVWMRLLVGIVVAVAVALAVLPVSRWEQEQAAGKTWAVNVGESPSRRPPVIEVTRSQKAPASVYDPIVLRAAGRRLLASSSLLLIAMTMATALTRRPR